MSDSGKAVFLSYASQDAEPARRIADALRAFGVEVWFDQSELRGGDAWDQKIRKQIHECALFVPVISRHTHERREGYFRREWKLAVDRTHDMAEDVAFLVPVVIDDTSDAHARVPDKFRDVQWTRLPGGEAPAAFVERVKALLQPEATSAQHAGGAHAKGAGRKSAPPWHWLVPSAIGFVALLALAFWQPWRPRTLTEPRALGAQPAAPVAQTDVQRYLAQVRKIVDEYDNGTLARDNLELADQLCQKALQQEPLNAEAWALASQVSVGLYRQNYDPSRVRRDAIDSQSARALKLTPELPEAQFANANALRLERATLPEAERILRGLVDRFPTETRYLQKLASVFNSEGKREESLALTERMIQLLADNPMALFFKSGVLAARGRNAEAEQALDLFLARQPNEAGYVQKFEMLLDRGDVEAMRRVLSEIPPTLLRNDNLANWAAAIWLGSRDAKRARAALQAAPGDYFSTNFYEGPKAYFEALTYMMEGSREAARAKWEDALKVVDSRLAQEPGRTTLLFLKADILGRLERITEAEQVARVFRQLVGNDKPTWLNLHLSVAMGRTEEAITYLETWDRAGELSTAQRVSLRFDPRFDSLRGNPRFEALLVERKK